jgi:hypothetical protein
VIVEHVEKFRYVASIYTFAMVAHGFTTYVLVTLSKDETKVKKTYCLRSQMGIFDKILWFKRGSRLSYLIQIIY